MKLIKTKTKWEFELKKGDLMSLSIREDVNGVLGRKYNVEYLDGRGRCCTFNNTLVNVDGTYFWFENKQDGLALVKQDRVTFMYCTDKPKFED